MRLLDWFQEFVARQSKNFKVLLISNAIRRFFGELTMQYREVYTRALGASSLELGFVNSISAILRTAMAIPTGMLIDKYSLKKLILLGQGMSILVPLIYAMAFDWRLIIFAMIWQAVAMRIDMPASWTANLVSLNPEDRATGRGLNATITSTSAMIASLVSTFLIIKFGGISAEGIRPLFIIQIFGSVLGLFALFYLKDIRLRSEKRTTSALKDLLSIFKTIPYLKLVILMNVLRISSMQMIMPFRNIYLVEVKGADATILGSMVAISTIISLTLALPLGRVADRFGRKKLIYLLSPFQWISLLIIVFAPSPEYLLLAGFFDGFSRLLMEVAWSTFMFELIPLEARGRWIGIINLFNGIGGTIMPIIGGFLYEIAPEFIFYIRIIMNVAALPIVNMLPERYNLEKD